MTLAEFRKKHPKCTVGYPRPVFPAGATIVLVAIMVYMLRYLIAFDWSFNSISRVKESLVPFFVIFMCFGVGAALYGAGKRLGVVIEWVRNGRHMFAVAEDEAFVIDDEGELVVFPIASVTRMKLGINSIEITVDPSFPNPHQLSRVLRTAFDGHNDCPSPTAFFEALEPHVKRLAPQAEIKREDD